MDFDALRKLSGAERKQLFQAAQKIRSQASDAATSTRETQWHMVDADMTPDQYDEIPLARPRGTRTPVLWVKFRHPWLQDVVVARGRFDFDGGTWTARLSSVEDGDSKGKVAAIEWARIVVGERPWDGPTIRRNEADPW
jgi:hypothetical protein